MSNEGNVYYKQILDAIPLMVFVVDEDVRIQDLNRAAALFGDNTEAVLRRRAGDVLHCLHSQDVPEGCGRGPFCRNCIIRSSVRDCLQGQAVNRRRTHATHINGDERKELELLITTSPMPAQTEPRVLLMIEDISEISTLRSLIPICFKCKGIRDDADYWHSIEDYFNKHIGVDFSHGLCPKCMTELYPGFPEA